jgi:uncharacterized protein (DUF2249 family)
MALKDRLFKRKRPEWAAETTAATRLDVRPLLARGGDPLELALEMADKTGIGGIFIVDAPFDPAPMRRMFSHMGFEDYAEKLTGEHWQVHFRRVASAAEAAENGTKTALVWSEAEDWHIDVRGLDPPEPMRAIVSLIDTPAVGGPVIVHHDREPIYLYPELAERGWRWAQIAGEPGEVRLRLERDTEAR